MTDTKLREARIAEAKRRVGAFAWSGWGDAVAQHLCDLYESDWRPEPEVDAVTLAAREWMKGFTALTDDENDNIDAGRYDDHLGVKAFRAGHAHGQANCVDVRRMDWLERRSLFVDRAFGHGHPALDATCLRTKIDRAMGGGQ